MKRSSEGSGATDAILLLALLILGGVLGRWQNTSREKNRLDTISSALTTLVSPVSALAGGLANGSSDFSRGLFSAQRLSQENRTLRAKLAATALYTEQTNRLQREIVSLRSMVNLSPPKGTDPLAVDVLGFFPRENRITLSAGKNKGVVPGMPVVVGENLLAIVQTVDPVRCQALLITSPSQKVGALVLGHDPAPLGIASGLAPDRITLPIYEPKATVRIGDGVITSGFGERIPRGISIGRVSQVQDNEEFGTRNATVTPSADLGSVREVVILR